jgi:zinc and cadmium transporter
MGLSPTVLILCYCLLITLASLAGGWLPSRIRLTHLMMQLMLSFVSGILLGVALLHMLPHAVESSASVGWVAGCMLAGVLLMFFLLRIFHVHDRQETGHQLPGTARDSRPEPSHNRGPGHDHAHSGQCYASDVAECHGHAQPHQALSWLGVFVGLLLHSLLDGVALAASVGADAAHDTVPLTLLGFGTFLAILLHKPLDALSVTSLMQADRWSPRSQAWINVGLALSCPLGALLFWAGASRTAGGEIPLVGSALAFSAGFFLCIALSDLLPEVAFHEHDRLKLSAALLAGVVLAAGVELLHVAESDGHGPHNGSESQTTSADAPDRSDSSPSR